MAAPPYPPGPPGPPVPQVASAMPCSKVELSISCKDLYDSDILSKSDPIAVVYSRSGSSKDFVEVGRTEWQQNTLDPHFTTAIPMDYRFEETQKLRFSVYDIDNGTSSLDDDDYLGSIECTLGEIVSSTPFTRPLKQSKENKRAIGINGTMTIRAEELSQNPSSSLSPQFAAVGLDKKDFLGKSDPYLEFSKQNPDGTFTPVYKTEVIKNTLDPVWKPFDITSRKLCNNDPERKIKVTCYDWDSDGSHDLIGEFETTLADLESRTQSSWDCINQKKKEKKKKYKNSGIVKLLSLQVTKLYSFLDYVMGGCQINFTVGIDFTASNKDPSNPSSLHYLDPHRPNQYTSALIAVGEVCQSYDTDKLFPALGFGAQINGQVSHEFALNGNPSNPYCAGIQGVVEAYHNAIRAVKLWGPTNFAPIINHVARFAAEAKKNVELQQYFVLLMLTDGAISDMDATKAAIVAASFLPMSIIIVGVGGADFSAMDELDADDQKLSSRGTTASRDIVQFVPFRKFEHAPPEALASAVLAEIPQQLTDYMLQNKLVPMRPPPPPGPGR